MTRPDYVVVLWIGFLSIVLVLDLGGSPVGALALAILVVSAVWLAARVRP